MASDLSKQLNSFIVQHVETVGQLEVLLLLFRYQQRSWEVDEIARELRGTPEATARWLERWQSIGLVRADGKAFRYGSAPPDLDKLVAELAWAFQSRPAAVTACIHARPGLRLGAKR